MRKLAALHGVGCNGGFDNMSSARKRNAIQKANNEAEHLRQRLTLEEYHGRVMAAFAREVSIKCNALQAKLDALMLEFCPDEMTEEQKANWEKNQRPVSADVQREIDLALMGPNVKWTA